jgi:hypothetical protein
MFCVARASWYDFLVFCSVESNSMNEYGRHVAARYCCEGYTEVNSEEISERYVNASLRG